MDQARWWWRGRGVGVTLTCACLALALPAAAEAPPTQADAAPPKTATAPPKTATAPAKPPPTPHRVKLAYLGLRPLAGVDKGKAQAVSAYLLDALQGRGVYQVLSPDDVKALLGFQAQKQLLGCNDDSACLAQIAGSLGARRLLDGTLARIGSSVLVSINLLDTEKAEAVIRVSRRVKNATTLEPVLDVIPGLVDQLVAGNPAVTGQAGTAPPAATTPPTAEGQPPPESALPPQLRHRRPRLTLGLDARGGTAFWNVAGGSGFGPGGSFDLFGLLRVTWFDIAASVGVEGNLFGGTLAHGATRIDLRIHLWHLPYVQLYVGPGIRFNPLGFRAVLGADWPLHVFGREDFAILTDLDLELYGGGVSTHLTVGLGYSFL